MKASRELDYLIAEKIFDLTCLHDPPHGILLPVDLQVKNYSTQIADAWLVVERFIQKGYLLTLEGDQEDWRAYIIVAGTYEGEIVPVDGTMQIAATAPLAICLAALKAVSEDV